MPRTEALQVHGQLLQFITNMVLVEDPRSGIPLPERLGLATVSSPALLRRVPRLTDTSWRTYYPETGHTVTYRFRLFYLSEGGPAALGYPVTEKYDHSGALVQYFENAMLIWHATSGISGFESLAPLGEQLLHRLGLVQTMSYAPPARQ